MLLSLMLATACGNESQFDLAADSRIPSILSLPSETSRGDIEITLTEYTNGSALVRAKDKTGHVLSERLVTIQMRLDRFGNRDERMREDTFPHYTVLASGGTAEVIEFRRREPCFA